MLLYKYASKNHFRRKSIEVSQQNDICGFSFQMVTYGNYSQAGWFFWAYKCPVNGIEMMWSFRKAVEIGLIKKINGRWP